MPWILLSVAILFEVAGTTSMKLSRGFAEIWPSIGVFVFYLGAAAAIVLAFDFAFMGGSMGVAAGEAMVAAARRAVERETALMQALPQQIAHAKANAPFFKEWLKDVDPASVSSREALAKLPVLRKSMLGEVQKKNPPMGGLIAVPMSKVRHVFMSPGPIFEVDTDEPDYFRGARAMHAGGFRPYVSGLFGTQADHQPRGRARAGTPRCRRGRRRRSPPARECRRSCRSRTARS